MKTKSIILSGLLLASLGAVTTSCEDMFTTDNSLVTTELAPKDSMYQVLGIINRMQKLADRTVLLGELRSDLVDINPTASTTLQEIANNRISVDNEYNSVADYYSVINSCNIFLDNVDSLLITHNEYYYEKEIVAVKTFRAWTYLQLVMNYGKVPFITKAITTANAAEEAIKSTSNRADMKSICDFLIADIEPYIARNVELPNYGSIRGVSSVHYFIPLRVMLAELYLWRGSFTNDKNDFLEAAKYYHDFFTGQSVTNAGYDASWSNIDFEGVPMDAYSSQFNSPTNSENIAVLPLDTCAYDGTYSDLNTLFCSQYNNNYYVPITPSVRNKELSTDEVYCLRYVSPLTGNKTNYYSNAKIAWDDELVKGDLRLYCVYKTSTVNDRYNDTFSKERQIIIKYMKNSISGGADVRISYIPYYRTSMLYLHFAEALNCAGFPETAFAVLKYGLSSTVMTDRGIISSDEYQRISSVATSMGGGTLASWPTEVFVTREILTSVENYTMMGIHSKGCGRSEDNEYYTLPTDSTGVQELPALTEESTKEDSLKYDAIVEANAALLAGDVQREYRIPRVEELILKEEALEGMFEGYRFYDLMRYAMRNNDADFVAKTVAYRKGKNNYDATLYESLKNGNWYLPLPER